MTTAVENVSPSVNWKRIVAGGVAGVALVVGTLAYRDHVARQEANERFERASAEFCGRHDALKYAATMQTSLEQAATQINPALKDSVAPFMGGLGYALAQPGVTQMPVYGKGIYALVPSSLEGEALRPIQILMQTADNKCVAFGLSGFGAIVPADPLVNETANNASFFKKTSSHGEAPACDQALRSLSKPSI